MNAASGDISFPSDKLQVLSVSKTDSIMNLWIRDPSFSNSEVGGDVHFEGIVLNPGFTGTAGNLVTIAFEAIAPGDVPISFSSGAVLANDGNGTNILNSMQSGDVTVVPGSVTRSPSGSDQVSGSNLATTTKISLAPLSLSELPDQDPTDPQPIFTWYAAGASSRNVTYTVKIGDGDWFNATTILVPHEKNEYQLPLQAPTPSTELTVVASDPAGDSASSTISFSVAPIPSPSIDDFTRQVPSSDQLFSVEGTAPSGTTIRIYLQKSNTMLVYTAPTDDSGRWSIANEAAMTSGMWKFYAQARNAQGALSKTTPQYSVRVNGWFDDLFGKIVEWSILCLVIILLLGAIVFLALIIVHQIRKWRVSSNKEVIELENRLRNDLQRIEKELDRKDQARKKHEKEGKS